MWRPQPPSRRDFNRQPIGDALKDEPSRVLLPVVVEPLARDDFNAALHLYSLKRVEAPGMRPYPPDEAARRLLHSLALTPRGATQVGSQTTSSMANLLERGEALISQRRYAEALPLIENLTHVDEQSFDAWFDLGWILNRLGEYDRALAAFDRALALDPNDSSTWASKSAIFNSLARYHDALTAIERAVSLDDSNGVAWRDKANILRTLGRVAEAEAAERRAKELGG